MNKTLQRVTVSGLTLLLLGGIVTPSVASADTTSSATVATTKTDVNDAKTYTFESYEMPYTTFVTDSGTQKKPWYSKVPQSVTKDQAHNTDYQQEQREKYNGSDDVSQGSRDALLTIYNNLNSFDGFKVTLVPGETVIDFAFDILGADDSASKESVVNMYAGMNAIKAWEYSWMAKITQARDNKSTDPVSQADMKKDFVTNIKPKIENNPVLSNSVPGIENLVNTDATTFDSQRYVFMTAGLSQTGLSEDELANLDFDGTMKATKEVFNSPASNMVSKGIDDSDQLSGFVLSQFTVYAEALKQGTTDPTPTPAASQPVTVHYVDNDGNTIAADKTLTGKLGDDYKADAADVDGYKLTKTPDNATGKFTSSKQSVTFTYTPQIQTGSAGATIAPKGSVVYATKTIGLYKKADFTKKTRKQLYHQKARTNRPMFVVTGYASAKNGAGRYKVKDVNHHSKTAGKTGYVTANANYTVPVYYQGKQSKITVINPNGINAYSKKTLKNKKAHYKQGQVLKVKKIVSSRLTTRFVLSNGRYITANKQLVQAGKKTMAKQVRIKRGVNRYQTANLTKRNRHYSAGTTLKVKGWAYSNANNFSKGDSLRYKVSGGYITANQHFVRTVK